MIRCWKRNAWLGCIALRVWFIVLFATATEMLPVVAQDFRAEVVEIQAGVVNDVITVAPDKRDKEANKKTLINDLKSIMHAELYFLFLVTDLDKETQKIIKEEAEQRLESFDDLLVRANVFDGLAMGFNTSQVVAQTASGLSLNANPYTRIQSELKNRLKEHANSEETNKYARELKERVEFRRQAVVDMVVYLLDKHLTLSTEQQEQIKENLIQDWEEAENISIGRYLNDPNFIPIMPFPLIDRVLNREQRTLWRTLPQHHFPLSINGSPFTPEWGF